MKEKQNINKKKHPAGERRNPPTGEQGRHSTREQGTHSIGEWVLFGLTGLFLGVLCLLSLSDRTEGRPLSFRQETRITISGGGGSGTIPTASEDAMDKQSPNSGTPARQAPNSETPVQQVPNAETPARQSPNVEASANQAPNPEEPSTGPRINLNTADAEELKTLPGIGDVLAGRIVAWREEHGPFLTPESLMDVPGIGEKKFAALTDRIIT